MTEWLSVAEGVWQARYQPIDVSICIVRGDDGLLLVDTRCNPREAAEIMDDVHELGIGSIRWVVNTHAHYDHSFGNQVFAPSATIYGHHRVPAHFREFERGRLLSWSADPSAQPQYDWTDVVLTPPHVLVEGRLALDIGGRIVNLIALPPGHTDTDLVVHIPDAACWLVGDVVEESGPPMYGSGSFPFEWPTVVRTLAEQLGPSDVIVPGHGSAVDRAFLHAQARQLDLVAREIRAGHSEEHEVHRATASIAALSGLPEQIVEPAVRRGYAQLDALAETQ